MKKKYRILENSEFSHIINQRKRLFDSAFSLYFQDKILDHARFGLAVSKKVGNAVIRNKIKRQLRMIIQNCVDYDNFPYDCIVVVTKTYLDNLYEVNQNNFEKLIKKCKI